MSERRPSKRKTGEAVRHHWLAGLTAAAERFRLINRVRRFNRWQLASITVLVLLFGGAIFYYYTNWVNATSELAVISSQADWEAGEYQPGTLDTTTTAGALTIKSGGVGTWDPSTPQFPEDTRGKWDLAQEPADVGTDLVSDGTYLYMIIGGHQPEFFRYNPDLGTWKQLANAPTEFYHGSALTYRNGTIYAINSSDGTLTTDATAHFFAYDIASNTWEQLEDAPGPWLYNADLVAADNNKIYAVQGGNDTNFYVYNISTLHWSVGNAVTDPISSAVYYHPLVYSDIAYGDPSTCTLGCVYAFQGNATAFFRYDIETGTWFSGFANAPGTISSGSAMALDEVNNVIYAFRGNNVDFMSYVPGATWVTTPPDPGRTITNGGAIAYLNGYMYATFGGVPEIGRYNLTSGQWESILNPLAAGTNADGLIAYVSDVPDSPDCNDGQTGTRTGCLYVVQPASSGFRRFRIGDNAWDSLIALNDASNPNGGSTGAGAAICYDTNNNIFISRGAGGNYIHTYNIGTNTWGTSIATGVAANYGSSIACTADNTFYWLRGNNTDDFYQYVGASFTQNDDFPNTGENHTESVYYGGALTAGGGYVYALAGNQRGNFFLFDPAQASGSRWIKKTDLPTVSYYTGVMDYDDNVSDADFIYAIPGKYQKDFWRYSVANDAWTRIADLPKRYGYSQSLAHDDANNIAYIGAAGTPGTSSVGIHKFNTTENNYIPAATWISAPIDLDYVSSFTSLTSTSTLNGNSITLSTRTSVNAVAWSAWDEVEGDNAIDSSPARYIQVKAVLNSAAGDDAPVLDDLTVTYEKDSTAPNNPTVNAYADSTEVTELAADAGSYYYVNPHFKFTSATELQSELSGYYVAWTTTPGFDPSSSEAYFQTGSTYTVNTPLQTAAPGPIYYLRVAAKDAAGNVTAPATLYTYTYTGIAQAISTGSSWNSQGEWSTGTTLTNTTATAGGAMRLSAVTNGAWTTEAALPWTVTNGASIIFDGTDTFYILRGTATQTFVSYSKTDKTFSSLANYGSNVTTGSSSIYIPANGTSCTDATGCLFATRGTGTTTFQRYNVGGNAGDGIAANTWTTLDTTDINLGSGSAMAWNGDDAIYLLAGSTAPGINVYKYKIYGTGANNWTQLSSVDQTIGLGGTLVYYPTGAGCADSGGCLFATRGANDTDFYKYSITANAWDYAANVPIWVGDGASSRRVDGYVYLSRGIISNDFLRYDVANNSWEWMSDIPTTTYQGSEQGMGYVSADRTLYLFRGYSEQAVYKYDIDENTWADTPGIPHQYATTGYNNAIVVTDPTTGLIYTSRGNTFSEWWSFDPRTNVWVQLTDIPHNLGVGADGEYVNHATDSLDGIYVLVGTEGQTDQLGYFYRYNISTNTWDRLDNLSHTDGTQYETLQGAELVFDGTDNIYTILGSGSGKFFSYDITDDVAGDGWTDISLAGTGNDPLPAAATAGTGSCAVKLKDEKGTVSPDDDVDYIYLVRGSGTTNRQVYRYRLTAGAGQYAWTSDVEQTPNPAPIGGGACVVDSLNNLLVPVGTTGTSLYVLDPDGDIDGVWTTRTVPQTYSAGDLAAWDDPDTALVNENVIFGARGGTTSALDRYVVATVNGSGDPVTGFERRGTWTSGIVDFNSGGDSQGVYGYSGLEVVLTEAANTSYKVETRTCANDACAADASNVNWGAWTEVTNARTLSGVHYATVASAVARYGQARVSLKSDQVLTSSVDSVTWKYYLDAAAPNNPTPPISAYMDDDKATPVDNDDWVNDLTPYFEWTASDNGGGIGLKGFYVYFGMNESKDPVDDNDDATNLAWGAGVNHDNFYNTISSTAGSWFAETQSRAALTNGTYYLRLKTVDRSNNVTAAAVTAFTFKVDNGLPSKPTGLSVTPSNYSSTNSYTFSWSASTDTGGSGILEYCYKVGEDGAESCTPLRTISDIQATQTRGNTFYLRSHDNADNYSSDYATIVFYYAGDAPTAPLNLVADPVTTALAPQEDTNSFSFSWNLPSVCLGSEAGECSAADIDRYCYTVNELPTAETCGTNYGGSATPTFDGGWTTESQTSNRMLPPFSAAKLQGENIIYVVARDDINNIDYDNYVSRSFYFTSDAPGAPVDLQATDSSDRASNRYSITLTWDVPDDLGSGVTGYRVYRCAQSGDNCDSPSPVDEPPANYTNIATVSTLGYLDTSLDNAVTYSYLVRATGSGSTVSGNSSVVEMRPEGKFKNAPALSGQPAVQARIRSADISWVTLNDLDSYGEVIEHTASSLVEYGLTTGYGSNESDPDLVNDHAVTLTDLEPDTTYHYRCVWTDVDGNQGNSSDFTFTTLGAPSAPLNLTASTQTGTENSFTFTWEAPQDEGVTVAGYYYSINNVPNENNVTHTTATSVGPIDAATQQGTNTFYVLAEDNEGNLSYSNYASVDFIAYTTPPDAPQNMTVLDSSDRNANRYTITITWDAPDNLDDGTVYYTIYRSTNNVTFSPLPRLTSTGYLDTALDKTITYYYYITAADKAGAVSDHTTTAAMKPQGRFKAAPAMSGEPASSIRIRSAEISWITANDQDQQGNSVAHPASSFIQYGTTTAYGSETGSSDLTNEHSVTLTDLTPNTEYHYKLKWVDVDGNIGYSNDYSFTTLGAPSAPTGLTVSPETSTSNSFTFNWVAPADEGVTVKGYYYSINDVPVADKVTFTTATSLEPIAAATQQGTNTFYVVAVDDGDNVNYANYASVNFEAHTPPPTQPRNITIVDSSDRDAKRFSITITWDAPISASGGSETASATTSDIIYTIYRSDDNGTTYTAIAETRSTGYLDAGLNNEKKYTYKILAKDSAGAASDTTTPVAKQPEGRFTQPPAITQAPAVVPDSFSAAVDWETERVASSFVLFGLAENTLDKEQGTADLVVKHGIKVTGLKAATTYYYQVKSIDVDENIALSSVGTFTTLEAPKVSDVKISDVRLRDALITWNTNKESTAMINYGPTANYGLTFSDLSGSFALTHTVKLENLSDGQLYHLRIAGQDRNGNPIASDDYTFTTLTFPKISDIAAKNKSAGQTEISWQTNVPTTSSVEYYGDVIPPKTQGNTALVTDHSILLYGLEDATRYKFKVHGSDQFGYEAVSNENEFTTLEDTTPPEVFGVKSESNTIGSGEASKIQIIINWKTNEPTTSQVDYGVGLSGNDFTDQTEEAAELVMEHLVVIGDLSPAKTYHFRTVSKDKAGNQTKSGSYSVLTSRKRESFLQLIIGNLEETFSWVGNIGKLY